MFTLSPRLAAVAAMIPPDACIADIGTDHAYLPIRLLHDGIVSHAIACDISAACVQRAEDNAARYGIALDIRQADGLTGLRPDECDTVILSGMGGETIAGILNASPWAYGHLLICQCASRPAHLRTALYARGCGIVDERIVRDAGRLYPVFAARRGTPISSDAVYAHASPALIRRLDEPDTRDYLIRVIRHLSRDRAADPAVVERLRRILGGDYDQHRSL